MALARNRRSQRTVDYWPGFVDALSTLLLAIMFLLTVFVLAQFFLSREISGKDDVLTRLTSQINELTQLLALEKSGKQDLEDALANIQASLAQSESDRSRLQQLLDSGTGVSDQANARVTTLTGELDAEKQVSQRAMSQIENASGISAIGRSKTKLAAVITVSAMEGRMRKSTIHARIPRKNPLRSFLCQLMRAETMASRMPNRMNAKPNPPHGK